MPTSPRHIRETLLYSARADVGIGPYERVGSTLEENTTPRLAFNKSVNIYNLLLQNAKAVSIILNWEKFGLWPHMITQMKK